LKRKNTKHYNLYTYVINPVKMNSTEKGQFGENAVTEIAFNTYLKYWCFPNPKDETGSKKEICDLLILFKSTAIIISIKNYSFKGDYERYFRSTLDKSVSQIEGAERKLFKTQNKIHIKHPDLELQIFEPSKYENIHRITINLNTIPLFYPPGCKSKNGFIHVFNWNSFLRLVLELNTIPDFINYLKIRADLFDKRESLFLTGSENDWDINTGKEYFKYMNGIDKLRKQFITILGDELDLLADYYNNNRKFNKHFYSSEYTDISFELDGKWHDYLKRKEVKRKKADDKLSYFIDEFVKNEVLYKTDKANIEIATELLSLSRFERRIVGKHFFEFFERYRSNDGKFVAKRYGKVNDLTIGFLLHGDSIDDENVMAFMDVAINGYCYFDNYQTNKIVLIATSNKLTRLKFGYLKDVTSFPKEYEDDLIHDLNTLNWFKNFKEIKFHIKEYPDQ